MFKWTINEADRPGPSREWYLGWGIFTIGLLLVAVWQGDPLSMITFALISAMLLLIKQRPSQKLSITINQRGVAVNQERYPFNDFKSFSIKGQSLELINKKIYLPPITLTLGQTIDKVRLTRYLKQHLPRTKARHSLIDNLIHKFGL